MNLLTLNRLARPVIPRDGAAKPRLTVVRLVWAEQKFRRLHGRYGALVDMTNLVEGLPPDVTAGRMGSYMITLKLPGVGYIL